MTNNSTPPAILTEALTVRLDDNLLAALNSYRQAEHEFMTTTHAFRSKARQALIETVEAEAERVATWLNLVVKEQLGERDDD